MREIRITAESTREDRYKSFYIPDSIFDYKRFIIEPHEPILPSYGGKNINSFKLSLLEYFYYELFYGNMQ